MIRTAISLLKYQLLARDGNVGEVRDFLFDDEIWQVRYLVVDTGRWLARREVLIAPEAVRQPEWDARRLPVELTKEQVRESPPLDPRLPLSPAEETKLREHYGWGTVSRASDTAGFGVSRRVGGTSPAITTLRGKGGEAVSPAATPGAGADAEITAAARGAAENREETSLRSMKAVTGYHIEATDGSIGHVEDFLIDDESWEIRFLVVDTRNWLPGRKVLLSPQWIINVSWPESHVTVALTREAVERSPEYDPEESVTPEYADRLQRHYAEASPPRRPAE